MPQTKTVPLSGVRKIIAERLVKSHLAAPHSTIIREVDVTTLRRLRETLVEQAKDIRVSYLDMFVKACAEALRAYPIVNSRIVGDEIRILDQINIGVAVSAESGLIVPVLRGADQKPLRGIAEEVGGLVSKARKGSLTLNEVTGGTFTITNLGMFGVDTFIPIINPPESAILGVGRIIEKPLVVEGDVEVRSVVMLSLTFDHRVIDGAIAAQFLGELSRILEKPEETSLFKIS